MSNYREQHKERILHRAKRIANLQKRKPTKAKTLVRLKRQQATDILAYKNNEPRRQQVRFKRGEYERLINSFSAWYAPPPRF